MKRRIPTPAEVYDPVTAAVEAALRRREQAGAVEAARARAAALRAAVAADRAALVHPTGEGCARCGATHPGCGWSTSVGVDGLPSVCCTACADPTAGLDNHGWMRPVLRPHEIEGVLLSRLLNLRVDVPWLAGWGRERYGLVFSYAPGPQAAPWAHVDVEAWRPVGRRAEALQRAFGGPHVPGNVTLAEGAAKALAYVAQHRHSASEVSVFDQAGLTGADGESLTGPELDAAEDRVVAERLAVLDAEAAAKVARLEADAVAAERGRVRYGLGREFRAAQAERERAFRRLLASA